MWEAGGSRLRKHKGRPEGRGGGDGGGGGGSGGAEYRPWGLELAKLSWGWAEQAATAIQVQEPKNL